VISRIGDGDALSLRPKACSLGQRLDELHLSMEGRRSIGERWKDGRPVTREVEQEVEDGEGRFVSGEVEQRSDVGRLGLGGDAVLLLHHCSCYCVWEVRGWPPERDSKRV
jgi:hypothetical protein